MTPSLRPETTSLPDRVAVFVAEAVYEYLPALPCVERDIEALTKYFEGAGFRVHTLVNRRRDAIAKALHSLESSLASPGTTLVVYWAGHGVLRDDQLQLCTHESRFDESRGGLMARELVASTTRVGAAQTLVILDTGDGGYSPGDLSAAIDNASRIVRNRSQTWFGLLASSRPGEAARDDGALLTTSCAF